MDQTDLLKEKLSGPMQIAKADLKELRALQDQRGDAVWAQDEGLGQQLARRIKSREIDIEDAVTMIGNGFIDTPQFKREAVGLMGRLSNVAPSNAIKSQIEKLIPTKKETIVDETKTEAPQLTKEEIQALEAEKASIAATSRARLLAESRSRGDNLDMLPTRPTVTVEYAETDVPRRLSPTSLEHGDPPAVALAEKALAELEDQIRTEDVAFKKNAADALKSEITRRALLVAMRNEAAAAVKDARELAERETLAQTVGRREESQQSYDQITAQRDAEALAEVRGRVQPLLDRILVIQQDVIALFKEHGPELKRLGDMSWNSVPPQWDYRVRDAYGRQVLEPAKTLHRELLNWLSDVEQRVIPEATTVTTRYQSGHDWALKVNTVIQGLRGICGDLLIEQTGRVIQADPENDGYANAVKKRITAIGLAAKDLERRGGPAKRPVIEILIPGRDEKREARRADLLEELEQEKQSPSKREVSSQESAAPGDSLFE